MAGPQPQGAFTRWAVYCLSLTFVVVGMANTTPSMPGWDELGLRRFPIEYFLPAAFATMLVIVALDQSGWRQAQGGLWRRYGALALDIALVVAALGLSLTYLVENEASCLIDRMTGVRAELIAEALVKEAEIAQLYGLPAPSTVDDPACVFTTGPWLVLIVGLAVVVFLAYNVRVWGLSLVLVSVVMAVYGIATVLIWYWAGDDGMNKYLVTSLGGEPRSLADGRPRIHDILINQSSGLFGQFLTILMNTVFPYIVLGTLLGASAGGRALIKVAFLWTRRLSGGPAHAAVVASALFGTTTGTPVVNVLGTGVLTIPMMIRRGFSPVYAGGIEAAASSGGQIMPPIMGVAAFVLAAITGVVYRDVAIAATIPALAYFFCMFLSVMFQSRKQGITPVGEITEDMRLLREDRIHIMQIFLPVLLIIVLLLLPKDAIGCDPVTRLLGADIRTAPNGACLTDDLPWVMQVLRNTAGDAGSVGWWATILLIALMFLDRSFRAAPLRLLSALADAGRSVSVLFLMFLAVSVIDIVLNFTGLAYFIALDVLSALKSLDLGTGAPVILQMVALSVAMLLAILMGMGMPAVPAYINAALLMGPLLAGLGIATFTAHLFIFYFACASAITPPVAIASYAAASISKADPMRTSFSALRSGVVMFVIPFVFAFHPELLLVEAAVIHPEAALGGPRYIPGYDGTVDSIALVWLLMRLALCLYLLASALARFDHAPLPTWQLPLRIGIALGVMTKAPELYLPAAALGLTMIAIPPLRKRLGQRHAATLK